MKALQAFAADVVSMVQDSTTSPSEDFYASHRPANYHLLLALQQL